VRKTVRLLTHPVVAVVVFAVVLGFWHGPQFYEAALQNKLLHVAEHLMFFAVALLFWWPVCSPSRVLPPLPHGAQMLYLLAGVIVTTPLFAYLTFSHDILYPTYEYAPRVIANFSPADDQLLAGVSMQLVGVFVAMVAFAWAFSRWYQEKK
jgi:putative membrane protein